MVDGQHKQTQWHFWRFLCLIDACLGFFPYTSFFITYYGHSIFFCVCLVPFLLLCFSVFFFLFRFICFYLFLHFLSFLDPCLFLMRESKKRCGFEWEERWRVSGKKWRRRNHNKSIVFEKYLVKKYSRVSKTLSMLWGDSSQFLCHHQEELTTYKEW